MDVVAVLVLLGALLVIGLFGLALAQHARLGRSVRRPAEEGGGDR